MRSLVFRHNRRRFTGSGDAKSVDANSTHVSSKLTCRFARRAIE
jgi:hypothetical protein